MKTELTLQIEKAILLATKADKLGVYGAYEVSIGKGYGDQFVDYITMDTKNIFRCYEIKISLQDLKSKNKLSFCGDYNYLVITYKF